MKTTMPISGRRKRHFVAVMALLSLVLLTSGEICAQVDTAWTRLITEPLDDFGNWAYPAHGGEYFIGGRINSAGEGGFPDLFYSRFDPDGNEIRRTVIDMDYDIYDRFQELLWDIGGEDRVEPSDITFDKLLPTGDGGYLILGSIRFTRYDENGEPQYYGFGPYLWKLDIDGSTTWMHAYGEGNFHPVGFTLSGRDFFISGDIQEANISPALMKIDMLGREQWTRSLNDSTLTCRAVTATPSGMALACTRESRINNRSIYQPSLIFLSNEGRVTHRGDFDIDGSVTSSHIACQRDGTVGLSYTITTYNNNVVSSIGGLFLQSDSLGREISRCPIEGQPHTKVTAMMPSANNGFAITAKTGTPDGRGVVLNWDLLFMQVDAAGDSLRAFQIAGDEEDDINAIVANPDGSFLLAGSTSSFNARRTDIWLVKVNPVPGEVRSHDPLNPASFELINCYPNPFNSSLTIDFPVAPLSQVTIAILNQSGQQVDLLQKKIGSTKVVWDASGKPAGIYFVDIRGEKTNFCRPITLLR